MPVDINKYRNIMPGTLNPDLTPRSGTPIARPSNIIDDPMAVYRRTFRNIVSPNIFEGVNTFRGIVLQVFKTNGSVVNDFTSDVDGDVLVYRCMIPELDLDKPNPFAASSIDEYANICSFCYPAVYTAMNASGPVSFKAAPIGSVVHIRFDDPSKTFGIVTGIEALADLNLLNALGLSGGTRGLHNNGTALPALPGINEGSGAAYISEREQFADALELLDAYPQLTPELANKIVEVGNNLEPPVDPAWLANVINYETGYTFDPSTVNAIGATGLIQFLGSTAKGLGTTTEDLAVMSASDQMDFVQDYFQNKIDENGPILNANDAFMAVFYPPAMGAGPDFSIYDHAAKTRSIQFAEDIKNANRGITTSGQYTAEAFAKSRVQN